MNGEVSDSKHRVLAIVFLLIVLTLIAYWKLKYNQFVRFDDDSYIVNNIYVTRGLSLENILWAFDFSNKETGYWHPLTWLSLMLDFDLFGLNPSGFHIVNLLFHITNSTLLFLVFNRMTGSSWQSAFIASIFALHPVNVESVAWAVERKTVLSSFFWFLAMLVYFSYSRQPALKKYLLVFLCFALGLMAKPMLVTLPFVLLLLDYWPLGRNRSESLSRLFIEKIPLLILSIISVSLSILSQKYITGIGIHSASFSNRTANALISYVAYMGKMFWPSNLAVFYPLQETYPRWQILGALSVLSFISIFSLKQSRERPWFFVGWFWYIGVLFPAIGFVRTGLWPSMADRFAYLPLIGLFIIVAWGVGEIASQWRYNRSVLGIASAILLGVLIFCTRNQTGYWKESLTLFQRAISVTKNNVPMLDNLGFIFLQNLEYERAIYYYNKAIEIDPRNYKILTNLGVIYGKQGDMVKATEFYKRALQMNQGYVIAHLNLGNILKDNGMLNEAIKHYSSVLSFEPDNIDAHMGIGIAFVNLGRLEEAIGHFTGVLHLKPDDSIASIAHNSLGISFNKLGKLEEAQYQYTEALRLNPSNPFAHKNLALLLANKGKNKDAIVHLEKALTIKSDYDDAKTHLEKLFKEAPE